MAIDTSAKRLSSLDFEEVWAACAPLPDGTVSQADRQHSIWSYAGILVLVISTPTARTFAIPQDNRVYPIPEG